MLVIKCNLVMLLLFSAIVIGGCSGKGAEQFIITAHRGASYAAPENTFAAIEKAIGLGADYVELDVRITKDGQIVLIHDRTLNRTTNGRGELWDFTLEELRGLDAGSWFGGEFRGEPIPTLREVIELVKGRVRLNIEIKVSREEPEIVGKVVDIVRSEKFEKDCMVTSFTSEIVEEIKEIAPDIRTGLIFGRDYPADVFEGSWEVLSCNQDVVDEEFVARAKNSGKLIHVWTVDEEDVMRRLIGLGVDGIITNRPDLLKAVYTSSSVK